MGAMRGRGAALGSGRRAGTAAPAARGARRRRCGRGAAAAAVTGPAWLWRGAGAGPGLLLQLLGSGDPAHRVEISQEKSSSRPAVRSLWSVLLVWRKCKSSIEYIKYIIESSFLLDTR